jgi:class 3 adenylate cyclase/tetratricopeptide (TPR) repeat protein
VVRPPTGPTILARVPTVSFLFVDQVSSTAQLQALGDERTAPVRRALFDIIQSELAAHGGTLVDNTGDGVMATFNSAVAAVDCAAAIQRGVLRHNRRSEIAESIDVRAGVHVGEPVIDEAGRYFGMAVVVAARLCAAAEGGQVLVSDLVRALCASRDHLAFSSVGSLALKGVGQPVPAHAVAVPAEPLDADVAEPAVPLPGRLAVRPAAGVVGRDAEVKAVLAALDRVSAGEGREVVVVSGEAGQGKTTVVAEAARSAFEGGACVLFGHCEEDIAAPYQLFTEALGHFITHAPQGELIDHVESWGSALARLVPELSTRMPGLEPTTSTDSDTERYQAFAAVVGLLTAASQAQPIVLVLDDLQWADRSSLQLLRHVLAADQHMRLLVLGTSRDTELSHSHPLMETLADLHRHGGVVRVELTGLDDTGVASLMEAAAGHALDDTAVRLARAVHRETDGNPFFVSEVLRHLWETGAIFQDAATSRWDIAATVDATVLPASVRTVISARVGRLGDGAARALSLAAVIGRDFDLDVLARAASVPDEQLLDILDAATAAALVRELTDTPGHYTFAHALIQHTLYEQLGRTRQARAHGQVAEALEDLCGDRPGPRVGELARHWSGASQPGGVAKALGYSRRAADAALAALAPGDALSYYREALDLYAHSDDRDPILGIDLAIGLGIAQRQTGDAAFRATLLEAARRAAVLDDTERLVAAALANNRGIFSAAGAVDADRVEVLELALERLPTDDPSRALVLARLCSELTNLSTLERRQALADEAVALARSTGDDATIVRVLNDISFPLSMPHLLDQTLAWSTDALRRAERIGDPVLLFWAAHFRAVVALRAADIEEMDRCLEVSSSVAERLDQPILNWISNYTRALRAQFAGDTDEAEARATEALQIGTASGQPDASPLYFVQAGMLMMQRGAMRPEHIPFLEELTAEIPENSDGMIAARAAICVELGRLGDAHHLLEQFAASDFQRRPHAWAWLVTMVMYGAVAVACRDTKIAESLFDRLAPFAEQVPTNFLNAWDRVSHYLGSLATVLGRYGEADAYFKETAEFNDRADAKFFKANTNLAWGTMLLERDAPGDAEQARELLAVAHAVAATHGFAAIKRRTAEALEHLDRS